MIVLLVLLNVVVVALYLCVAKRLPSSDNDAAYYDENGNHIYYDRKLIARLEKEKKDK